MFKKKIIVTAVCLTTAFIPICDVKASTTAATTGLVTTTTLSRSVAATSTYENLGMSVASSYLNVRSSASTSSKVVGKLYCGSVATIKKISGDWVKIKSGSVTGYVYKNYLAMGADARALFIKYANPVATVNTSSLRVRKSNSTDSKILGLVSSGQKFQVISQGKKWTKIRYKGKKAYVANPYVDLSYTFEYAVSVEEEESNIQQEIESSKNDSTSNQPSNSGSTNQSTSKKGEEIAAFATKYVGNPYVWGGTSLTKGADCSGFIQTVYKNFGYTIPRTSRQQAVAGKKVSEKNLKPGDIISYASQGVVNHVALYIGNRKVVHASNPKDGIKISNYNYRNVHSIRRIVS